MKKIIIFLSLILSLMFSTHSFAQLTLGVRGGINIANMRVSGISGITESSRLSINIGAMLNYSFTKTFSLESGLMLSGKGANFGMTQAVSTTATLILDQNFSPMFLEMPINAIYKVDISPIKLQLFGGPYFAFGVAGNRTNAYTVTGLPAGVTQEAALAQIGVKNETVGLNFGSDPNSDLRGFDFGLNIGAGAEYKNIIFRIQYGLGISNLISVVSNNQVLKSNVMGISIGYMFGK